MADKGMGDEECLLKSTESSQQATVVPRNQGAMACWGSGVGTGREREKG